MKKEIMKRAWEIKKEADRKTKNQLWNMNIFRELLPEEKALFSVCLKIAWAEYKLAKEYEEKYEISTPNAYRIAKAETNLSFEFKGEKVTWKLWKGYGKFRAYYTVSGMSRYWNNKRDHFVTLAA